MGLEPLIRERGPLSHIVSGGVRVIVEKVRTERTDLGGEGSGRWC